MPEILALLTLNPRKYPFGPELSWVPWLPSTTSSWCPALFSWPRVKKRLEKILLEASMANWEQATRTSVHDPIWSNFRFVYAFRKIWFMRLTMYKRWTKRCSVAHLFSLGVETIGNVLFCRYSDQDERGARCDLVDHHFGPQYKKAYDVGSRQLWGLGRKQKSFRRETM